MSYRLAEDANGTSIRCLRCGRVSYNPNDVQQRFCGFCAVFHPERVAIWLDDLRSPTNGHWHDLIEAYVGVGSRVIWVKNYDDFVQTFSRSATDSQVEIAGVFFDNDLGYGGQGREKDGHMAFTWMEEYVRQHHLAPFELYAQTMNSSAKQKLYLGFESLKRWWETEEK